MRTSSRLWVASLGVSFAAFTVVAGCDDGGDGSCGKVEPCGGDVVGDWKIGTACLDQKALMSAVPSVLSAVCPEATLGEVAAQSSGSLSFGSDLSYAVSLTLSGTVKVNIPASCLSGLTCGLANGLVQVALVQKPEPTIKSVKCAGTATCVCKVVLQPQVTDETGSYATSGTELTLDSSAGASQMGNYCVQGNELHLVTLDQGTNAGPTGRNTIIEDIVSTRR